jgi:hypothetical protein
MRSNSLSCRVVFQSLSIFLFLLSVTVAGAAPPSTMNYQGRLLQTDLTPFNGSVSVVFRLYETASGGTALWEEAQPVSFSDGFFSVNLGTNTPLTPAVFANPVFLGVTVSTDSEMVPRHALSSTPYAFKAQDAGTINGGGALKPTGYSIYGVTNTYCEGKGSASFQSSCKTRACGTTASACSTRYYNCNGACLLCSQGQPSCPNTVIGVVGAP